MTFLLETPETSMTYKANFQSIYTVKCMLVREAAKNNGIFLVARPLREGGGLGH